MDNEHFFVTGALGCIGAWVVRNLVRDNVPVTIFDLASNPHRLKLIMTADELAKVQFVTGDITDLATVQTAIGDSGTTHIIHLAALQVPFCKADPPLGARVNVVGTVNIFESAKRMGLKRVVYASSVAVFGRDEEHGGGASSLPSTLYGVYKQANEGTAQIYHQDAGITSIGLRPYTVYGPGRDQGITSAPSRAMMAVAFGQPFHIPFGGYGDYQYTDDTAKVFIQAARVPFEGADVFNLRGSVVHMREIIDAIQQVDPSAKVTFDDKPLALPDALDDTSLVAALGQLPQTSLNKGVEASIALFKQAIADGRLTADRIGA